jgi:hypothetical protein
MDVGGSGACRGCERVRHCSVGRKGGELDVEVIMPDGGVGGSRYYQNIKKKNAKTTKPLKYD